MPIPFQIRDLRLHRKIAALDLVPTAPAVAAAVREVDGDEDGYVSSLWLFPLDGGEARRLTHGPAQDSSPRWSPDAQRLAFLRAAGGSTRVHLLPVGGGEATPCGDLPGAPSSVRWTSDGRKLLVTAAVPSHAARIHPPAEAGPAPKASSTPEVAWRLPYKSDGIGYLLARDIHLFELDPATGAHRQLTHGSYDVYGVAPSPDGRRLAYSRTRGGRYAHRTDLWLCAADGTGPRRLAEDLSTVLAPAWSPDGRRLAFAAAVDDGEAQNGLYVLDVDGGGRCALGDDLEVADGESIRWSDDGRRILFSRARRGCHEVCSIDVASGELRVLAGGPRQFGALVLDGRRSAYAVDRPDAPSQLWALDGEGAGERRLHDVNAWWRDRTPLAVELRSFQVPDGRGGQETIEGWVVRSRDAQGPQPLLDDAHGGPASYGLLDFDTNVYWQVLCSQGWAVLVLNAVGSASYGREFCRRLQGRWGQLDLPQHLAAIEQLRADGTCDGRAAIVGKSYGGFLAAWAVGHTDTYKAAVVMAPVGNVETHYGTSDGGWYADPLYVGTAPRFDRRKARELSPLQSIEASKTPVLFLQGKDDERCPKCQSEEMFVSLMRAGDTPTELVLYPGEDHHFLGEGSPSCRHDAAARIVAWLRRWVLEGVARTPQGNATVL